MTILWQLASCHEQYYTDNVMVYTYIPFAGLLLPNQRSPKKMSLLLSELPIQNLHMIILVHFFDNIIYTRHFHTMYMCKCTIFLQY